ncbi:MAG TPA: Do family serine endopeptidase [Candidatus Polarisedimenticolaceae bacterium]|nr:Do family serine endopeptidase [Candidatus Polarisedimenticolaceae bacterium]
MEKKYSFAALLAVIAFSIVFGMVLGGRLNSPQGMFAARPGIVLAQNPLVGPGAAPADFADIAEAAIPAVVSVTNTSVGKNEEEQGGPDDPFFYWFFGRPNDDDDRQQPRRQQAEQSFGSGFIISHDGYILTNNHVVEGATKLKVEMKSGTRYDAKVVGTDPSIDMALIKIDTQGKQLPSLPLGDSDKLRVGEWVVAIGNPLNLDNTVTVGVVSAKERRVPIGGTDNGVATFIQTDAAINRGNSGGPLLDSRGRVVGMNTAILRGAFGGGMAEGIGFALPITDARSSMEQILETGEVKRGFLGISMNTAGLNESAREFYRLPDTNGVIVQQVTPGEAGDKAGLEPDDIIRKVDGEEVKTNLDLIGKIAHHRPGDKVALEVWRDGKPQSIEVTLGARDQEKIQSRYNRREDDEEGAPGGGSSKPANAEALGIKVRDITPAMRGTLGNVQGVLVEEVDVQAEAADEGIEHGVVITQVNRTAIRDVGDFRAAFSRLKPGDPVRITLRDVADGTDRSVYLTMPRR